MRIYLFDRETKEYLGQQDVDQKINVPDNSTTVPVSLGTVYAEWDGNAWINVQTDPKFENQIQQTDLNAKLLLQVAELSTEIAKTKGAVQ